MKKNRQVDNKKTFQVRVDKGFQQPLKVKAAKEKRTVKALTEEGIVHVLGTERSEK